MPGSDPGPDGLYQAIPLRVKMVAGHPVPVDPAACEPHTRSPDGYLAWHAWTEKMEQTHDCRQCSGCGLWSVWEPRETAGERGQAQ